MSSRLGFQILLGLIGIGLLVYGMDRGEPSIIFHKAVNICLECIGIG